MNALAGCYDISLAPVLGQVQVGRFGAARHSEADLSDWLAHCEIYWRQGTAGAPFTILSGRTCVQSEQAALTHHGRGESGDRQRPAESSYGCGPMGGARPRKAQAITCGSS